MLESLGYINNNDIAKEKDDDIYINVLNKSDNDIFDDRNSIGSMDNAELRISGKKLTYDKLNNFLRDSLQKNENKEIQDNKDIKDMIIEEKDKNTNSKNIK